MDTNVRWKMHKLPDYLETQIKRFMAKTGLMMASFDFRFSDGKYFFFEINPNGQFIFLEVDDRHLKVTSKVAELLYSFAEQNESAFRVA
jgi:glutathione synthase/RimK-type ligase-like ATP-grasp enzyme